MSLLGLKVDKVVCVVGTADFFISGLWVIGALTWRKLADDSSSDNLDL